jgi:hypothetical protein
MGENKKRDDRIEKSVYSDVAIRTINNCGDFLSIKANQPLENAPFVSIYRTVYIAIWYHLYDREL